MCSRVGARMNECVSYSSARQRLFAIMHKAAVKWAIFRRNFIFHFFFCFHFVLSLSAFVRLSSRLFIAISTVFRLSDIMINDFITWVKQEIVVCTGANNRRQNKHTQKTENRIIIILFMHAFCLSVLEKPQEKLWPRITLVGSNTSFLLRWNR